MQVQVKLLPLGEARGQDLETLRVANMQALDVASHLRDVYGIAQCEQHRDVEVIVVVIARLDGAVHLDKEAVCCDEFRQRIFLN